MSLLNRKAPCDWEHGHNMGNMGIRSLTIGLRVGHALNEDPDEPGQGVLVHGVDGGQVGHAEEQHPAPLCHRDVNLPGHVYVLLGFLRLFYFYLKTNKKQLLYVHC